VRVQRARNGGTWGRTGGFHKVFTRAVLVGVRRYAGWYHGKEQPSGAEARCVFWRSGGTSEQAAEKLRSHAQEPPQGLKPALILCTLRGPARAALPQKRERSEFSATSKLVPFPVLMPGGFYVFHMLFARNLRKSKSPPSRKVREKGGAPGLPGYVTVSGDRKVCFFLLYPAVDAGS